MNAPSTRKARTTVGRRGMSFGTLGAYFALAFGLHGASSHS
jgi:hypothetical protein